MANNKKNAAVDAGTIVGLIQAMMPSMDTAAIQTAVESWLDDHPEATTTVADGAITEAKLASAIAVKINQAAAGVTNLSEKIVDVSGQLSTYSGIVSEITIATEYNRTVYAPVIVKAGKRVSINGGINDSGIRISFIYADGTNITSLAVRTGINYRAEKDIVKILFYSSLSEAQTYTITVYDDIPITNFLDRTAVQDGYISGNTIASGYYHTDFIPVALGDKIIAPSYPGTFGNTRMYFYNAEKSYKGYVDGVLRDDGLYEYSVPLSTIGSAWVIGDIYYCAFNLNHIGKKEAVCYINAIPDTPLEYGQEQPRSGLFFNAQQKNYVDAAENNALEYTDSSLSKIVTFEKSANLFDMNSSLTEIGKFWSNNSKIDLSGYVVTNPIPVSVGDVLLYNKPVNSLYGNIGEYVDAEGGAVTPIKAANVETTEEGYTKHTCTRNGYVQFNTTTGAMSGLMIVKNVAMPETYVAFSEKYVFTDAVEIESIDTYTSPLKGKLIAYNGDSICESRLNAGTSYNGGGYAKIIADTVDGSYENRAISGGILASAPGDDGAVPNRCVVSDVQNMTNDADLICFEGGINDYWRKVPLGDFSESDYSGTLDTTTICGALESIFRQATEKWVGKPIVFVIVHKIKSTVYVANTAGYTFAQAREKMIGICNKYAIPYYDAFSESGLNAYNNIQNTTFLTSNATGNPDGCHPNEAAYKKYYVPQLISLFESVMPRS